MGKVKFISPIKQILGKLSKRDSVYYRRLTSGSDVVFSVKREQSKVSGLSPRRRLTCDLMTFVSQAVSDEIRHRRQVWEDDFEYYKKDCELFAGMRSFARLRDYVFHILYLAVIEYFRDEIGKEEEEDGTGEMSDDNPENE